MQTESVETRLRRAFLIAARNSVADGETNPTNEDVVFLALKEAMGTLKRVRDPEAGWLFCQGFWPQIVQDYEDKLDNFRARLERIKNGEEGADEFSQAPPSPDAVARMEAIFEVFPKLLVGVNRRRDWKILCYLGNGLEVMTVARLSECHRNSVMGRRSLQLSRIADKLSELLPSMDRIIGAPRAPRMEAVAFPP